MFIILFLGLAYHEPVDKSNTLMMSKGISPLFINVFRNTILKAILSICGDTYDSDVYVDILTLCADT